MHYEMTSKQTSPSLLVLAAGMGSRYGGLKQVDPVGPNGETLMDYSLHDARKAGFKRVVFLIRREIHETFHGQIGRKYTDTMEVDYAYQETDDLPPRMSFSSQREKPWGTGHAVWCARHALKDRSFAVINADDFYGASTFEVLIHSMSEFNTSHSEGSTINGSIVGYRLAETLSDHGSVSRGICKIKDGVLQSVEEWSGIHQAGKEIEGKDSSDELHPLTGQEIVSMNVWAFPPSVFSLLEERMVHFLQKTEDPLKDEFYLPAAVDDWISAGLAIFQAGIASCKWMGVTYREDKPVVINNIRNMILGGEYPNSLF